MIWLGKPACRSSTSVLSPFRMDLPPVIFQDEFIALAELKSLNANAASNPPRVHRQSHHASPTRTHFYVSAKAQQAHHLKFNQALTAQWHETTRQSTGNCICHGTNSQHISTYEPARSQIQNMWMSLRYRIHNTFSTCRGS